MGVIRATRTPKSRIWVERIRQGARYCTSRTPVYKQHGSLWNGACEGLSPRKEGLCGMEDSLPGGLPLSVFPNPMSTRLVVIARHAVIKWHFCQFLNVKGIYKIRKILEQSVYNLQSP